MSADDKERLDGFFADFIDRGVSPEYQEVVKMTETKPLLYGMNPMRIHTYLRNRCWKKKVTVKNDHQAEVCQLMDPFAFFGEDESGDEVQFPLERTKKGAMKPEERYFVFYY